MKKLMLSAFLGLTILSGNLFASDNFTGDYLKIINNDINAVNNLFLKNLTNLDASKLELVNIKLINIEKEVEMLNNLINSNNKYTQEEMDKIITNVNNISNSLVQLAGILAYYGNIQANNANESYNATFQTLIATTLRLSDDIGKMADRILLMAKEIGYMADRIGVMADRILETQRIQSVNYNNTLKLLQPYNK